MKVVKGNYGECRFVNNMDLNYGIPSLNDKSFELCFTDPPYGVAYEGDNAKSVNYNDAFPGFAWLEEALRICKGVLFTPGATHLYDYIIYKKPKSLLRYAYYPSNGRVTHVDPIVCYGTISNINKTRDIKEFPSQSFQGFKNPSPKSYPFWFYYMDRLKPSSVLDPFLGSGTTAEVCEELGIPWLGYEIMGDYEEDIRKRIKSGIAKHKQTSLFAFVSFI